MFKSVSSITIFFQSNVKIYVGNFISQNIAYSLVTYKFPKQCPSVLKVFELLAYYFYFSEI